MKRMGRLARGTYSKRPSPIAHDGEVKYVHAGFPPTVAGVSYMVAKGPKVFDAHEQSGNLFESSWLL